MKQNILLLICLLEAVTGCQKEAETENNASTSVQGKTTAVNNLQLSRSSTAQLSPDELVKAVRAATARFHSSTQAIATGYESDDHCVSVPGLGGMGYHWVNFSLVDPVFDAMRPEVVLYETGPAGKPRLVAVEYIVIKAGQAWPKFGDRAFDDGGTPVPAPHWSLHVWLHKENPNGMFTPFNPNVSCP